MKHLPHPKGINLANLIRMADYIETVPQDKFDMYTYRYGNKLKPECDSVGCVVGHFTILEDGNLPRLGSNLINFSKWVNKFIGTDSIRVGLYLFGSDWQDTDNTPTGAAKRIRYYVANGLPENWREQLWGEAPLSYL